MSLEDEQISKIIDQYKKTRERERKYYHEVKKNDEEFVKKNRERAKNHYQLNKEKRGEDYVANKEFFKCKALYYYYKRNDKCESFMEKHSEKVDILNQNNFKF